MARTSSDPDLFAWAEARLPRAPDLPKSAPPPRRDRAADPRYDLPPDYGSETDWTPRPDWRDPCRDWLAEFLEGK